MQLITRSKIRPRLRGRKTITAHVNIPEDNSDQEGTREHETHREVRTITVATGGRVSTETISNWIRSGMITLRRGIRQSEEHNVGLYL